jgi:hypothetical protein
LHAGLSLTDHLFTLPLNYACQADGEQQVFVREVVSHGRAKQQLPFLLFLQGACSECLCSSPQLHAHA